MQALSCPPRPCKHYRVPPPSATHPSLPACFSRRCRRSLASRHTVVAAVVASRLATVAVAAAAFATVIVARLGAHITIWLCTYLLQARADAHIMMAALYKARDLAQYVPEPIPSKELRTVTGRSHPSSAQGVMSEWVTEEVPQLTPASMLMPLVDALPPPDMRLPPKPIRRLDPAAVRHFNLQAVVGAPPPATAIDGGPLPAQASAAMASREATSSSLSGRSSADGSQKPASKAEIISQLALSLSEARPKVSGASRLHSRPRHATHPPWVTPESPYISTRACMPART